MKKFLTIAFLLGIVLIIGGSAKKKDPVSESKIASKPVEQQKTENSLPIELPDFSKLTPDCFVPYAKNPILKNDSLFAGSHWNDPHVLKIGSDYVMYASSDNGFNKNVKIYRLISKDGITWDLSPKNAVFERSSNKEDWDSGSTETPAVALFKGTYYLFYTAYATLDDPSTYKVGYATSPDGITFTRQGALVGPTDPKGQPNFAFNQYLAGEPAPVVFNNKLYLYFTTLGVDNVSAMATLETIGLITTSDGKTWSKPVQTLIPDQKLYPRKDGWIGYSTPHAQVLGGKMHLFFDLANEKPKWHQEKIHHAVSDNGISNWRQDSKAIFSRSDFAWTANELLSPAVYLEDNTLMLWFSGSEGSNLGIGFATCKL